LFKYLGEVAKNGGALIMYSTSVPNDINSHRIIVKLWKSLGKTIDFMKIQLIQLKIKLWLNKLSKLVIK